MLIHFNLFSPCVSGGDVRSDLVRVYCTSTRSGIVEVTHGGNTTQWTHLVERGWSTHPTNFTPTATHFNLFLPRPTPAALVTRYMLSTASTPTKNRPFFITCSTAVSSNSLACTSGSLRGRGFSTLTLPYLSHNRIIAQSQQNRTQQDTTCASGQYAIHRVMVAGGRTSRSTGSPGVDAPSAEDPAQRYKVCNQLVCARGLVLRLPLRVGVQLGAAASKTRCFCNHRGESCDLNQQCPLVSTSNVTFVCQVKFNTLS